jgi:EmrB/QacA subfamily drug resistance transporter
MAVRLAPVEPAPTLRPGRHDGTAHSGDPAGHGARRGLWIEPARPAWLRRRSNAHYYALAAVCVGAFMGQLDASIVTIAFPTLQRVFHASVASVTWVGLSYLVVLVAAVTAVGRLADMVGRKLLYTYGFVVFIVGSALCALAPSLDSLDVFRVLQALGAAMLQANSVAIIYLAMPKNRLGRGLGIQGAAQALGLALGPSIGGLLLAVGGWRLIFLVNVPAGILGTVAAWIFLPRSRNLPIPAPYDWVGLGLFVPAIVALLMAVTLGSHWGWTSPHTVALYVVVAAAGAGFVARERRARAPMLDLSLFRRIPFTAGVAGGLLSYLVLFGTMFAVPFFLERGRGQNPGHAGLVVTALPLALGCVAPFSGTLAARIGPRPLAVGGMALCAGALAAMGLSRATGWSLVAGLVVVGAGLGLFIPPNNTAVMTAVPRSQAGTASGVLNMTRGLGTALGLALTGLVFGALLAHGTEVGAAERGFAVALLFLAATATAAALLSCCRRRERPRRQGPSPTEFAPFIEKARKTGRGDSGSRARPRDKSAATSSKTLISGLGAEDKARFRVWAGMPTARRVSDIKVREWIDAGRP